MGRKRYILAGKPLSRSCGALDHQSSPSELLKSYFSVEELHLHRTSTEDNSSQVQEKVESEEIAYEAQASSSVSVVEYEEVPVDDRPPITQRVKPPIPPKPLPPPLLKSRDTSTSSKTDSGQEVPRISKSLIYRPAKKVHSGKMANLETLVEEKLCSDGIDLTDEPYSDKVSFFSGLINVIYYRCCLCREPSGGCWSFRLKSKKKKFCFIGLVQHLMTCVTLGV